eukprot:Gb_31384 [translate_table: standard]
MIWNCQSTFACKGAVFLGHKGFLYPQMTAVACPIICNSRTGFRGNTSSFFSRSWGLKFYENTFEDCRIRDTLKIPRPAIPLHHSTKGTASRLPGCNVNYEMEPENTQASRAEKEDDLSTQQEESAMARLQMEKSHYASPYDEVSSKGNTPCLIVFHAKSSYEEEYINGFKDEKTLKLPEGASLIAGSHEEKVICNNKRFKIDMYMNNLSTRQFGRLLIWSPSLPSTQTLLSQNFCTFPLGTACVADTQVQGKGRSGNLWTSPLGCLMFSFTLQMEDGRVLPLIQYIVSLAVIEAIDINCERKTVSPLNVRIKWPNDIYANGIKVGGVLCNSTYSSKKFNVTVGIGLNVDNREPTTCLNAFLQESTNDRHILRREELLAAFFERFENLYDVFLQQGFSVLESKYYDKWLHSGQRVLLEEREEGTSHLTNAFVTVQGLTSSGYLLATDDEGKKYELYPDGNSFDFFRGLIRRKLAE